MTFDDAVGQLRGAEAGGFGVSESQAGRLINEAVRRYAAESKWIKAQVDLGPTVVDQADYDVPGHVVDLRALRLDTGYPYTRKSTEVFWGIESGDLEWTSGRGGVFAPKFSSDGATQQIALYPSPSTAGQVIQALCAIYPETALSGSDPLPFPESHQRGVLNAAKAIAYEELDENIEQAQYYRDLWMGEAEELRKESNSRIGSGPTKFAIAGRRR